MTKAKRVQGVRITRRGEKNGRPGRPKGSLKKRLFEETRLGFLLKYETPLEYSLIMGSTDKAIYAEPAADLIDLIGRASKDPTFRKEKFRRYLKEYRENGLFCKRAQKLTGKRQGYYLEIRKNKR